MALVCFVENAKQKWKFSTSRIISKGTFTVIQQNKFKELERFLKFYDWEYEMSDDPSKWNEGREAYKKLRNNINDLISKSSLWRIETIIVLNSFLKTKKDTGVDFHFYYSPLYKILKESGNEESLLHLEDLQERD